jgi:hypothetical protein
MSVRASTPFGACFWSLIVAGFPTWDHAWAQEPAGFPPRQVPTPASLQTTVVQGAVAQYLLNADGIVDGLLLENNVMVRFPPHLGPVLATTVTPHDVVRVEGAFEAPGTLRASSIVDLQHQRAVVEAPPSSEHPPPRPGSANRQLLSAQGTIRALTHARHGEIDGAVLSEGTIIHVPPHAVPQFATLLHEGNPLAARGYGTANEYGRSLEVTAMGPSLDRLQPVAPGPDLKPPPQNASSLPSQSSP